MESEKKIHSRAKKYSGRIVIGLLSALILLGIGGTWFYRIQAHAAKQNALARVERIGQNQAKAISEWRKVQLEDADKVMKIPFLVRDVIRFLTDPGGHHAHLLEIRLASLQSGYHYDEIRVLDSRGRGP